MCNGVHSEAELEDRLSTPSPEDVEFFRQLDGDVLIIGVAGRWALASRGGQRALRKLQTSQDA